MKNKCIAINGQFLARKMTGQERFAYEIVLKLDEILDSEMDVALVVPTTVRQIPFLKNIRVVRLGKAKGSLWEQTYFLYYILVHRATSLNLCTVMPLLKPGIICIHDLSYKVNPQYFRTTYAFISKIWHKIQYNIASKFSPIIFTVSAYSKQQIIDIYNVSASRIVVLGNGWEHFDRVVCDYGLKNRKPDLFQKPFFFSLGSLAPNKNIEWILQVARKHPQYNFIIGGNADLKAYGKDYKENDFENVLFIGYITDCEIKTLMSECRGFIFPSFFEGFGIPPLEALSVGAKIIIANSSCLPEIFGHSAYYIDPYDINVDLDDLMAATIEDGSAVLEKYRFARFARIVLDVIK